MIFNNLMNKFFARNTVLTQQNKLNISRKAMPLGQQALRLFASSPQKNPYGSILTKLTSGSNQFSYYKLPALGDKRIGKIMYNVFLNFPKSCLASFCYD